MINKELAQNIKELREEIKKLREEVAELKKYSITYHIKESHPIPTITPNTIPYLPYIPPPPYNPPSIPIPWATDPITWSFSGSLKDDEVKIKSFSPDPSSINFYIGC